MLHSIPNHVSCLYASCYGHRCDGMVCIFNVIFEFGEEVKSCRSDNYSNIWYIYIMSNFQFLSTYCSFIWLSVCCFSFWFQYCNRYSWATCITLFVYKYKLCKRKDTKATCGLILRQLAGFRLEVVKTTSAGHARNLASTVDISTCPDGKVTVL